MNSRLLLIAVLFVPLMVHAQFEVEDLVTIPKTPEAAAFTEYANTASVSLYTGKASVSIPIDGLQGRNMSHPASLTYLTGGIKVQQEAGIVGLGWNLNVGGMVSRNVNGLPDDYMNGDHQYFPFYSNEPYQWYGITSPPISEVYRKFRDEDYGVYFDGAAQGNIYEGPYKPYSEIGWHELYRDFIRKVTSGRDIEIEPDSYSFSAGNISGTIVIDYDTDPISAYCLEHPDYLVEVEFGTARISGALPITGWTITDNSGSIYVFNQVETTTVSGDDDEAGATFREREYASGWYLTSMSNPHATDIYNFHYTEPYITSDYALLGHGSSISGRIATGDGRDQYCGDDLNPSDPGVIYYQYSKRYLSEIRLNGVVRLSLQYDENRSDLENQNMLDGILVYNVMGDLLNEYDFVYSYFGTPDETSPRRNYISRLRLDEVHVLGDDPAADPQRYTFDYDNQTLPDRDSFAQDYWGFYNGYTSNQGLVPANDHNGHLPDHIGNRNVNGEAMQAGVLRSVRYPTGGRTEFNYASNGYAAMDTQGQWIIEGSFFLDGGTYEDYEDPYNYENCDPQSSINGTPLVLSDSILITDDDIYEISVTSTGTGGIQGMAIGQFSELCEMVQPTDLDPFKYWDLNPDALALNPTLNVRLEPGLYRVMMINDEVDTRISLQIRRHVTSNQLITMPAGGLRVVEKRNFDENGNTALRTSYVYRNVSIPDSEVVSGVLHHHVNFESTKSSEAVVDALTEQCESVTWFASNQNTPTPNILTYSIVSELNLDGNGNPNGATVYEFYNDDEGIGDLPFYKRQLRNGMVRNRWVYKINENQNYQVQASEHSVYEIKSLGGKVGYKFKSQATAYLDPMLHSDPADTTQAKWVYEPMYFTSLGLSGGASSGGVELVVSRMDSPGSSTVLGTSFIEGEPAQATAAVGTYLAPCSFDHTNRTEPYEDGDFISDIADAIWEGAHDLHEWLNGADVDLYVSIERDPNLIKCFPQVNQIPILYKQPYGIPRSWLQQVSSTSIQYENGLEIATTRTYTYDTAINNQFQVRTVTSDHLEGRLESIHYSYPIDSAADFAGLQTMVQQNRLTEPFKIIRLVDGVEKSIKRTEYDDLGRPVKVQIAHSTPDVNGNLQDFLEDRMVVLEYQDDFNKVTKIRDQSGLINYYVWAFDGQQIRLHLQIDDPDFEAQVPGPSDNEDRVMGFYERYSSLPNSLVTVYDFDPGKGLIRQIDSNGRNTYYEYDSFGRLLKVINHEGHVLTQNEYHIINN